MAKGTRKGGNKKPAWAETGVDGLEAARKDDEERQSRYGKASRFRIDVKSEGEVILLDDTIADGAITFVKEHPIKTRRGKFITRTCLGDNSICPDCANDEKLTSIFNAGTVINRTGFMAEDDDGEEEHIRNYKQLLVLKSEAREEFLIQREKFQEKYGENATLALTRWVFRRGADAKSPATGTHIEFKGKVSREKLIAVLKKQGVNPDDWDEFLSPFDYEAQFAPPDEAEARKQSGMKAPRPGSSEDLDSDDDLSDGPEDDFDDEEKSAPKSKKGGKSSGKVSKPKDGKKSGKKSEKKEEPDDDFDDESEDDDDDEKSIEDALEL